MKNKTQDLDDSFNALAMHIAIFERIGKRLWSVILYLFYNVGLISLAQTENGEMAVGFMDDVTLGARAKALREDIGKILNMLQRPGGANEWSATHNSDFEHDKGATLGTTRKRGPDPDKPGSTRRLPREDIVIGTQRVVATRTMKYLGVILDEAPI